MVGAVETVRGFLAKANSWMKRDERVGQPCRVRVAWHRVSIGQAAFLLHGAKAASRTGARTAGSSTSDGSRTPGRTARRSQQTRRWIASHHRRRTGGRRPSRVAATGRLCLLTRPGTRPRERGHSGRHNLLGARRAAWSTDGRASSRIACSMHWRRSASRATSGLEALASQTMRYPSELNVRTSTSVSPNRSSSRCFICPAADFVNVIARMRPVGMPFAHQVGDAVD